MSSEATKQRPEREEGRATVEEGVEGVGMAGVLGCVISIKVSVGEETLSSSSSSSTTIG